MTSSSHSIELQQVAAAASLGAHVVFVVAVAGKGVRNAFDDIDPAPRQSVHLRRIVRQQAYLRKSQLAQHVRRRDIDTLVGIEAEASGRLTLRYDPADGFMTCVLVAVRVAKVIAVPRRILPATVVFLEGYAFAVPEVPFG